MTYPLDLEEQKNALTTDPQVLKYKKFREEQAKDSASPTFHFTAPQNNIGDPNGLSYWKGNWHLFYQCRPDDEKPTTDQQYPTLTHRVI